MNAYFLHLLTYENWANKEVIHALWSVAACPTRAEALMGHVLSAQKVWLRRAEGSEERGEIWPAIASDDMPALADYHYQLWTTHVQNLPEGQLDQPIQYRTSTGTAYENTLGEILTHLSHHAMYHRGQIVQLIRPQLAQVPLTDYIFWKRAPNPSL